MVSVFPLTYGGIAALLWAAGMPASFCSFYFVLAACALIFQGPLHLKYGSSLTSDSAYYMTNFPQHFAAHFARGFASNAPAVLINILLCIIAPPTYTAAQLFCLLYILLQSSNVCWTVLRIVLRLDPLKVTARSFILTSFGVLCAPTCASIWLIAVRWVAAQLQESLVPAVGDWPTALIQSHWIVPALGPFSKFMLIMCGAGLNGFNRAVNYIKWHTFLHSDSQSYTLVHQVRSPVE